MLGFNIFFNSFLLQNQYLGYPSTLQQLQQYLSSSCSALDRWTYCLAWCRYVVFTVVIYRCREMADNCGMCLALADKFACGWCQVSDRCEVSEQCDRGGGVWLNRNHTCPNPEVTSFQPQLGPWEGGTNITIEGINLGKTYQVPSLLWSE